MILEVGLQNLAVEKALTIGSDRNFSVASSAKIWNGKIQF